MSLYERPSIEFSRRSFSDGEDDRCRNIKTLFNVESPANLDEIRAGGKPSVCEKGQWIQKSLKGESGGIQSGGGGDNSNHPKVAGVSDDKDSFT